jgi:hypothetical protein
MDQEEEEVEQQQQQQQENIITPTHVDTFRFIRGHELEDHWNSYFTQDESGQIDVVVNLFQQFNNVSFENNASRITATAATATTTERVDDDDDIDDDEDFSDMPPLIAI